MRLHWRTMACCVFLRAQRRLNLVLVCSLIFCAFNSHSKISTTVTLSPLGPPALSLSTLIWRYVRQFVKMDAKEALQYVYCVCLSADQGNGVGKENLESAWELVRRIIVLAHSGPAWEELVGGIRPDGTKFVRFPAFVDGFRFSDIRGCRVASSNKGLPYSSCKPRRNTMSKFLFVPHVTRRQTTASLKRLSCTTLLVTMPP